MHTCIGAACGSDFDVVSGQSCQCYLQIVLYAASRRLALPAAELATIIFQTEGDSHASAQKNTGSNASTRTSIIWNAGSCNCTVSGHSSASCSAVSNRQPCCRRRWKTPGGMVST